MSSADKQKKRAQRAKSKAKQNRVTKAAAQSSIHPLFDSPLINEPFDDVKIDLSTFDFADIKENGLELSDYEDLFEAMHAAERISLLALCLVFLQYPVLELVVAEEDEEDATDFMMGLLISYRRLFHEDDEDAAVEWLETDLFQDNYNEASVLLQKKHRREDARRG